MAVIISGSTGINKITDGSIEQADFASGLSLGGTSLGANNEIRTNPNTINEDLTIATNMNGMSAGPITIANGKTVTINGTWSIV